MLDKDDYCNDSWQKGKMKKIDRECVWMLSDPCWSDNDFETACDKGFSTITGTLKENGFFYCPYCGGTIKVVKNALL